MFSYRKSTSVLFATYMASLAKNTSENCEPRVPAYQPYNEFYIILVCYITNDLLVNVYY